MTEPTGGEGTPAGAADKRAAAERTLQDIFGLMGITARLELADAADGGLSAALHLTPELPGAPAGKRSHVLDSLQFLVNKIVNKPGSERRWISLGIGAHPEPRGPKPARLTAPAAQPHPAAAAAPAASAAASMPRPAPAAQPTAPSQRPAKGKPASSQHGARSSEPDERSLTVELDPALATGARQVAETSARLGRFMAFVGMKAEERAQVLRAAEGVAGVKLHLEGEGRSRRVVLTPDKPTPMPKRKLPVEDIDDEDDDA